MVIWPAFRMRQYRVNDHPYHAPQFIERTKSERFCGDYFPFGMLSVGIPGSTVRIRFRTDDTLTSTGFFLKMGVYEPKPQQFVYPRQTSNMNFLVRQEALREQKADFTQGLGLE